jgi:hypothetical protein
MELASNGLNIFGDAFLYLVSFERIGPCSLNRVRTNGRCETVLGTDHLRRL